MDSVSIYLISGCSSFIWVGKNRLFRTGYGFLSGSSLYWTLFRPSADIIVNGRQKRTKNLRKKILHFDRIVKRKRRNRRENQHQKHMIGAGEIHSENTVSGTSYTFVIFKKQRKQHNTSMRASWRFFGTYPNKWV